MIYAMCYSDRRHSATANTFYGFDPYFQTCEMLHQSPTYFKRPALVAIREMIYCVETFEEDYMLGKLVVSFFDA